MARKRITWTAAAKVDLAKREVLPPFVATKSFHDDSWEQLLVIGSLWTLTETVRIADSPKSWGSRTYCTGLAYVVPTPSYWMNAFQQGTLAVYVGTTRVAEAAGTMVVEHLRPTFVVNGLKVLTADLALFRPAHVTDGTAFAGPA